jgi:very-short-patch-repair endonuclease
MRKKTIQIRAKRLRKEQTETEKKLWSKIRNRSLIGLKFRRQYPVDNYILDFYCPQLKLAIEADGSQHLDAKQMEYDRKREARLGRMGIRILRFSDYDILTNIEGVLEEIVRIAQDPAHSVNS